jgi:hypothetical protein
MAESQVDRPSVAVMDFPVAIMKQFGHINAACGSAPRERV